MKKTLKVLLTATLLPWFAATVVGQAPQQHVWYLPDQQIDFTSGSPVVAASPSTGATDPHESNGVHDANGKMIMKVVEGTVLNRYGGTIGYLQNYKSRGWVFDMAIVPVKNELCSYYIIYLDNQPAMPCCVNGTEPCCDPGTIVRYSKVDLAANGGQGAIVTNGTVLNTSHTNAPEGIAVSRADGSANRFLYHVIFENSPIVRRYLITGTGITFQAQFTVSPSGLLMSEYGELELSHDGSMLAFSNGFRGKICVIHLNPATGTLNTALGTAGVSMYSMPASSSAYGIEFTPDGSRIYVSDNYSTGIRYLTLSSGVVSGVISGTANWGSSYLELAYDPGGNHKIGVVAYTDKLGYLSSITSTPTFTNTAVSVYPGKDPISGIRRLPKQIDGEDYVARFASVPPNTKACCAFNNGIDVQAYNVTTTQTWSGTNPINGTAQLVVGQELRVKTGVNLTITNVTVRFLEQAKLVIEPGARLTINGTTHLTSTDCNSMWKGVELQGNYLLSQTTTNQGWFYLNSGTQISNAINGIRCIGMLADGVTFDWSKTGGVIRASGATFRNNKRDVEYLAYTFANTGSFVNCTFIIDAALNDGSVPYARVSMNAVKGIAFRGCDFRNITNSLYPASQRGYGIISIDATYSVDFYCTVIPPVGSPCPSRDRCVFEGFVYGINSSASSTAYTNTIRYSNFSSNQYNVYLSGITAAVVVENVFEGMDPTAFGGSPPTHVGLYLDRCTGYQVENNTFWIDEPPAGINTYGVLVNNSNNNGAAADVNQIYNNDFTSFKYGAASLGANVQLSNGNAVSNTGLTFKCNDFMDTRTADLYFNGQVSPFQGTCLTTPAGVPQAPANNTFSVPASPWDILNNMGTVFQVDYRYSTSVSPQTAPRAGKYITTNTTITPCTLLPAYSASSCPRTVFDGAVRLLADERSATIDHGGEAERKTMLIDGGDHEKMMRIAYGTEAGKLEAGLKEYAPYLTDEVLVAVVRRAPIVSSETVYGILKANAPLSPEVLQAVEQSAIADKVKEALRAEAGISPVRELLTQIAYHRHEMALAANEAAREGIRAETGKAYTGEMPGRELTAGDMELKNIMDRLTATPDGIFALVTDEALRTQVEALAARKDNSRETVRAAMVLQYVFGKPYDPQVPETPTKRGDEDTKGPQAMMFADAADVLNIYPNPARDIIFVESGLKGTERASIKIYGISGALLVDTYITANGAQVNVETLKSGVYMVRLTMPDGSVKIARMVIQK